MDLADAERSVHGRARLACAAASASDLPGDFRAWQVDGLRVVATTSPQLSFLNAVTGFGAASASGLPAVLDGLHAAGLPSPSVVTGPLTPRLAERLRALGFSDGGRRPIAWVDLTSIADRPSEPSPGRPTVIEMRSADERMAFLDVLIAGYATPVEVQRFLRAEHSAGAVRCFTAWADGKPVGAAAMSVHGRTAVLGGAATLPHHRGCGVQAALLGHRLRAARCAGAVAATATAAPGSPSARNLVRSGFHLEPRTGWNRPA